MLEIFDCGKQGHFKGAPICKAPKEKKAKKKETGKKDVKKKNESCRVKAKETSGEDTDDRDGDMLDSSGRVLEMVARSSQSKINDPRVSVKVYL